MSQKLPTLPHSLVRSPSCFCHITIKSTAHISLQLYLWSRHSPRISTDKTLKINNQVERIVAWRRITSLGQFTTIPTKSTLRRLPFVIDFIKSIKVKNPLKGRKVNLDCAPLQGYLCDLYFSSDLLYRTILYCVLVLCVGPRPLRPEGTNCRVVSLRAMRRGAVYILDAVCVSSLMQLSGSRWKLGDYGSS